ncbi:MAG: hypothetical protein KDA25_09770 [Phycisphaerales bacterium]|nr:hypothetical protein [Phycisphaerales bacterium]
MMKREQYRLRLTATVTVTVTAAIGLGVVSSNVNARYPGGGGQTQVQTSLDDFFMLGTQPDVNGTQFDPIISGSSCRLCHGDYAEADPPINEAAEPYKHWAGSMMAQATRDPIFHACLTIANQDAAFAGDLCLRCHTPAGWLGGRSTPTDGSGLIPETSDFEGVTCHFCHRLVDPVANPGVNPVEDDVILGDLDAMGLLPISPGTGQYVFDPNDVRRGPFDDVIANLHGVPIIVSPFHQESALCATCHDVSNPIYERQPDGTYALTDLDDPHPTGNTYDMFPVERTYSEWLNSQFASGGVQLDGRFGGNHPTGVMETCQDCHMPDQNGPGCRVPGIGFDRPNMPQHALNGGNTWVLHAVNELYPSEFETGLTPEIIDESIGRVTDMLRAASDMELEVVGGDLRVRILNYSGHKLPTGYPEGRRMWVNVKFYDGAEQLVAERGAYDFDTAELTTEDTKVYEARLGIDAAVAAATGLPEGESFHFALNNMYVMDNRIPPIGFTNAGFEAVQASPVGYTYPDGQYWDDTFYAIPPGATSAVTTLYFQTTSKEYIEFLRDHNVTNDTGQIAYDMWEAYGKSAPVDMDVVKIELGAANPADLDGNGIVNAADLAILLAQWGRCKGCSADFDGDGMVGPTDLAFLLANWG